MIQIGKKSQSYEDFILYSSDFFVLFYSLTGYKTALLMWNITETTLNSYCEYLKVQILKITKI